MNKYLSITLCLIVTLNVVSSTTSVSIAGFTITPTIIGTNLSLAISGSHNGYFSLGMNLDIFILVTFFYHICKGFGSSMSNVDMIMVYTSGSTLVAVDW